MYFTGLYYMLNIIDFEDTLSNGCLGQRTVNSPIDADIVGYETPAVSLPATFAAAGLLCEEKEVII